MISYEVKADSDDVAQAISLFEFVGGNAKDAIRVAINKAAKPIRTKASSAIRDQVRLKAGYVRDRLTIKKATRGNLSGAIRTPSRGLLLSRFSTDPNVNPEKVSWLKPPPEPPRGIKVKVKPSGSSKTMSNNFFYMVLPQSRALAIVRRRDKVGPRGGKIDVAYGPSLSQVFTDVSEDVLPEASEIYEKEMLDAIRFLLQKKFPKE